ncbi:MAG: STAS domain-containing protein [Ferruginibacter sp.]
MNVKINTKEKFTVISILDAEITAIMTGNLEDLLLRQMQNNPAHLVFNMKQVSKLDPEIAEKINNLQQQYYENNISFVICSLQSQVENMLDEIGLLEQMNITPTESEAWDIVQMEEIEREILGGE